MWHVAFNSVCISISASGFMPAQGKPEECPVDPSTGDFSNVSPARIPSSPGPIGLRLSYLLRFAGILKLSRLYART